jgi:hypothetical protein
MTNELNDRTESWSLGKGDVAVYTEDPETAKTLRKLLGQGATYQRDGKAFAWQFVLPQHKRSYIKTKILKNKSVENKQVAEGHLAEFDIRAIKATEHEERQG